MSLGENVVNQLIKPEEVWKLTLRAKVTTARKEFVQCILGLVIPILLFSWAAYVSSMKLPHDQQMAWEYNQPLNCAQEMGGSRVCADPGPMVFKVKDLGLTSTAGIYATSGILAFIIGMLVFLVVLSKAFDARTDSLNAEYLAYQDVVSSWLYTE